MISVRFLLKVLIGSFFFLSEITAWGQTTPTYPSGTVHCTASPTAIVDVTNPITGATWMDRNLGATQVATSATDANAYGDLYQWGRGADGHQCRNSTTTTTLSSTNQPGNSSFIVTSFPEVRDWRSPQNNNLWQGINGVNNPCPSGYRIPTRQELNTERLSWSSNNSAGAFASPLKWSIAGQRFVNDGSLLMVGSDGFYWSSTIFQDKSYCLLIGTNNSFLSFDITRRGYGQSVRCIKLTSNASDINENSGFTYPTNINYASAVNSGPLTTGNSIEVAQFTIRDGGASTDADALSTTLTDLDLSITENAQLDRVAIFNGSTNAAEVAAGSSVSFSGLSLEATDNGTQDFSIRVSFKSAITDNAQLQFAITSATAQAGASLFGAADAGGATTSVSGDDNRIEVTATALAFVQQPSNTNANVAMIPPVTVEAVDANGNRDTDYSSNISITSTGTLTGSPVSEAAVSGLATFNTLIHTQLNNSLELTASDGGTLTNVTSSTFDVTDNFVGTGNFNKISSLSEVTDGYYVILNKGEEFAMNSAHTGSLFPKTDVTPSGGTIINPATDIVWYIESSGSGRTIQSVNTQEYASYSGSSNNIQSVASVSGNNQRWSFTFSVDEFEVENLGVAGRVLRYNTSSPRFVCYNSSFGENLILYKFQTPPSGVSTGTVGTIAAVSAIISGNNVTSDGGSAITERGIAYSTSANPTTANSTVTDPGTTGSFNITLSGLNSSTTYYARAYATNSEGTTYGSDVSFTTNAPAGNTDSDIIENAGFSYPTNIDYTTAVNSGPLTPGNSIEVAQFTIRDGGASTDADALSTTLTDLDLSITEHDQLDRVAIFNGSTNAAEVAAGSSVSFSGLSLEATDNGTQDFSIRVSFKSAITDNAQLQFAITSATAQTGASLFAATDAGGATTSVSGDDNRIEVTATALAFVQQPTNTEINIAMSPAVTVEAVDANGNRDTDYSSNISITSTGTLTGSPVSEAAVSGLATFSALTHSATGTGLELTAGDGSLSDEMSSSFNINLPVTTIDFDTASYWTAGSSGLTSYAYNHVYAEENWEFTGGPAIRNASSSQDGYAGALGDYSWRLQNTFGVIWTATYGTALPTGDYFTQFGFSARRWDGSPSPNATVEYSVDGGSNWATASSIGESGTLNNTAFGNSSDWVTFTQSIASPASLDADKFIVRITTGNTERIMIDNFTYTIATPPPTVPTGVATGTADSITAISAVIIGNDVASEGGAAITERGVAYGTSSNPTTTDSTKTEAGTTGTFDVTLSNLNSSTTYYVRAYATNSYGTIYGNEVSFTTGDANSDVVENSSFTYPTNIDYTTAVNAGPLTSTNSIEVAQFTIRDGGDGTDADALSTALTGVNLDVTEHAQLDRIALFDGVTNIAEVAASSSIAFSSFTLEALDNGTKDFSIRVSFKSTVTDNKQLQFAVTSATAQAGGSLFAAADAGGAASSMSGDDNRIEVTATALAFVQQPGNKEINFALSPAITIEALDDYENRDLDYSSNISITSSGTLANSPVSVAAVSGLATFSSLTHTALGTALALTASDGTLADITSNSFNIFAPLTIISCDSLSVGDTFEVEIDGIKDTLTVVNRAMLDSMITNGGNFTEVCATKVTDMSYLFENQGSFDVDITRWDMSNVTNTEGMFKNAKSFNQDISNWDVSNVTNMRMMFSGAQDFNQGIGNWDVSNVTNMRGMFYGAHSFNKDLSSWDVSRVQDMSWMFGSTRAFNGNISGWNVSNVTNMDFMFSQAWEFNQPLSNWNVYTVNSMRAMFFLASNFNQDLSAWCVGNYINSKPPLFDKVSVFGNANLLSPSQSPAWGVPCGPTYPAGSVNCTSLPTNIVDVTNPTTGATWMDRNLGATQTASSSTDASAYGDLYQWGRGADGHQCRNSASTSTLSSADQPVNSSFIITPSTPFDWRSPQNDNLWQGVNGVNNPCPSGYRLPTEAEFNAERLSWSSNNAAGAIASPLKLPLAGRRKRSDALVVDVGVSGRYWSSTVSSTVSSRVVALRFDSSSAEVDNGNRAIGFSVRCIKD